MSVCVEQSNFKNNQYSQRFLDCDDYSSFQSDKKNLGLTEQAISQVKTWINRSRQRKSLATLDERMLEDIGYTLAQARIEFSKPFWK